jgi:hypothetical protein
MSGLSDYSADNVMNYLTGQLAMPALPSVWLALFTTAPTSDAGTGGTEVSGGAYARGQVAGTATVNALTASGNATLHFAATPAWIVPGMSVRDVTSPAVIPAATTVLSVTATTVVMTANATGAGVGATDSIAFSAFLPATASSGTEPATTPGTVINTSAVITFAQATATWGTVTSWGLYDALTVGNLLWWDFIGNFKWLPFTGTLASPSVLTSPAHGYANGDPVVVTTKYGGALPQSGSFSGVLTVAGVSGDTFNVGVNAATASGDGQIRKITQQSIPANVTASFGAATFILSMA